MCTVNLGINHANLVYKHWDQYKRSAHDAQIIETAIDYYLGQLEESASAVGIVYNRTSGDMCDHTTTTKKDMHIRAWDVVRSVPKLVDIIASFTKGGK